MGMKIDNTCEQKPMSKEEIVNTLKTMVFGVQAYERFNAKERETLDKAWNIIDQYETRLKADMVTMLTELQTEIEKHNMTSGVTNQGTWNECIASCSRVIQQKIDALKMN